MLTLVYLVHLNKCVRSVKLKKKKRKEIKQHLNTHCSQTSAQTVNLGNAERT